MQDKVINTREHDILKLWNDGLTLQEIGDKYNVTRERIRQILSRIRRRGNRVASNAERTNQRRTRQFQNALDAHEHEIIRHLASGHSFYEISKILNLSPALVSIVVKHLIKIGKTNGPRYAPTEATTAVWEIIKHYLAEERTLEEIAQLLSISRSTVVRHTRLMRENGIISKKSFGGPLPNEILELKRARVIREMLAQGKKRTEIAATLGISISTLSKLLSRMRTYSR